LIGAQVNRAGRAAITTELISPLDIADKRNDDRDTYNRTPKCGLTQFSSHVGASLAADDSVDRVYSNQILAPLAETGPARYTTLPSVLTDDRVYRESSQGACSQCLAVELQVMNLLPNRDCGGRIPFYDTIDTPYTALKNDLSAGATDRVPVDNVVSSTTIPSFLQPQ
jgi:hypothetical protein|tara:strand:- start:1707 stop:2210 length:504 start_codon:yes stop_codon:yes gene_type:complete